MQIIDVQQGETEQQALERFERETMARALEKHGPALEAADAAQPVTEAAEVERLVADAGAPALPAAALAPATEYVDAEDESVREGWEVRDLSSLDWALSRIADLEAERAENEQLKQEAIARIEAKAEKLNRSVDHGLAFFRSRVAVYAHTHRAELLKGGKKKSRKLPHGTIQFKKVGGGYEVTDAEALLAWARQQPAEAEVLRIREEPALAAIKKHVESTGEVPPGLEERPESEEIRITAEEE